MNNAKIIGIALSAFAVLGAISYIYILRADNKSLKGEIKGLEKYLDEATAEVDQCVSDKAITEKVSNDYQNNIANLRRQLNSLRTNAHCVPVQPSSPSGSNPSAGNKLSGGNGLNSGYLLDFAGRAEQDRLTALSCNDFINQLYKSRGLNQ